jgi:hypothetical protein
MTEDPAQARLIGEIERASTEIDAPFARALFIERSRPSAGPGFETAPNASGDAAQAR